MKKIFIAIAMISFFFGCKYDDDYLNPKLETMAYFASKTEYTRSVIVGEGMQFRIGAAMSGVIENTRNETVDMIINKNAALSEGKTLLPDTYYNSSELSGTIQATIPAGDFLGYFTVRIDSINFLSDAKSLTGEYAIPVKIVGTSLESVNKELSFIQVFVKYMSTIDGYYLYRSTVKKEVAGTIVEKETITESYPNESDNSTFRLETKAPFTVSVTPAVSSFMNGLKFDLTLNEKDNTVTIGTVSGFPEVVADGENVYNRKTRDFVLNYKYTENGTIYHVSQELIFRNRMVDGINQTREYLSYFN